MHSTLYFVVLVFKTLFSIFYFISFVVLFLMGGACGRIATGRIWAETKLTQRQSQWMKEQTLRERGRLVRKG